MLLLRRGVGRARRLVARPSRLLRRRRRRLLSSQPKQDIPADDGKYVYRQQIPVIQRVLAGGVIVLILGSVVLYSGLPVVFSPVARAAAFWQAQYTGIRLSWDSVSGSFYSGEFEFENLEVHWEGWGSRSHAKFSEEEMERRPCNVDLKARKFKVQVDRCSQFFLTPWSRIAAMDKEDVKLPLLLEDMEVEGLDLKVEILRKDVEPPNVEINRLTASDVNVTVVDTLLGDIVVRIMPDGDVVEMLPDPPTYPTVHIDHLQCAKLHVRSILPDVLFKTQLMGSINSKPMGIVHTSNGGVTLFCDSVPVQLLRRFLRPPLSFVSEGIVNAAIQIEPNLPVYKDPQGEDEPKFVDLRADTKLSDMWRVKGQVVIRDQIADRLSWSDSELEGAVFMEDWQRGVHDAVLAYMNKDEPIVVSFEAPFKLANFDANGEVLMTVAGDAIAAEVTRATGAPAMKKDLGWWFRETM